MTFNEDQKTLPKIKKFINDDFNIDNIEEDPELVEINLELERLVGIQYE